MAEPIRMSTLGRDARVGDFYNYFNDLILSSGITVPEDKSLTKTPSSETTFSFFYQKPDKFKRYMLNINSHQHDSIEKGILDLKNLWFANYLTANSTEGEGRVAQVTVFIRLTRRIETLDPRFISSRMYESQSRSRGRATHLMEEIVYGAEMICSIEKSVDWKMETKKSAERNLYLAAKDYFDHAFGRDPATTQLPSELNEATCNVLNSLEAGKNWNGSFQEFSIQLRNLIHDERPEKWKPIEIGLRDIPAQSDIETRLQLERQNEIAFLKEQYDVMWKWILTESRILSNQHSLHQRFPPLEKVMCQFQDLLQPFWDKEFGKFQDNTQTPSEQVLGKIKPDFLTKMIDWLAQRRKEIEIFDWLLKETQLAALDLEDIKIKMRNADEKFAKIFVLKVDYNQNSLVEEILEVTGDTNTTSALKLPTSIITRLEKESLAEVRRILHNFADEADLKRGDPSSDTRYHIALVPISSSLNDGAIQVFEKVFDFSDRVSEQSLVPLGVPIESLDKVLQNQPKSPHLHPHPMTPDDVSSSTKQQQLTSEFGTVVQKDKKNKEEENESMLTDDYSDVDTEEDTENSKGPASPDTKTLKGKSETNLPTQEQDSYGITKHHQTSNTDNSCSGDGVTRRDPLETSFSKMEIKDNKDKTTSAASMKKRTMAVGNHYKENDIVPGKSNGDHERRKTTGSNSLCREEETRQHHEQDSNDSETVSKNNRQQEREREYGSDKYNRLPPHEEFPSNKNIGEVFSTHYSQLTKKGKPNVYLLNAEETSFGEDFRCFDIGRPVGSPSSFGMRNHKIIILMGATGCGKSTLINGMVNYILGVKWNDQFRFKCVRDDETTAKNQAHSQTSSVTAYTLRHHDGMAVPYSITIIDTPGYGDTRGVQRDKEITRNIHQFLTQHETRVDEIHAACFVAASGNSRLTITQRYIIDSVLSIFGKDVKENIRLLVTFADSAHPPVVEACLAANFPVTSESAGITFSKFNSSVLYANNVQQGEDDFCFDELFWDMGQENFTKFFTMLENMNGKDLKSTRNVIETRGLLEQSLKDIEQELEVCFVKIENTEIFQRKMIEYGNGIGNYTNFTFEKTEMRPTEFQCPKEFFAYNCRRCRLTCEKPFKPKKTERLQKRHCDKDFCTCPASEHDYQSFEWRLTPIKITTTLKDMKAEYESNYDRKLTAGQLLDICLQELDVAKGKVLRLLDQVGINARKLDSTALRSNALSPADYLSLMRSRVAEEQAPGYPTRLETLTELQNCLGADASASASHVTTHSSRDQTHRLSDTDGTTHKVNYGFTTSPYSQHGNYDDYRTANAKNWQENCWKEAKTDQQSEVHQQEEPKGAPKSTKYFGFIPKWKY